MINVKSRKRSIDFVYMTVCFLKDHGLIVVRIKGREQALGLQF